MKTEVLVKALRAIKVETGSLACMGCGHEHKCSIHGCAGVNAAADRLEDLAHGLPKWIPVTERLPENEQDVLICATRKYWNSSEKTLQIVSKAFHTDGAHNTENSAYSWDSEYMDMKYDEADDAYLIPEGWWECVDYGENFCAVDDFVTHWMPLPNWPGHGASKENGGKL